MLQEEKIRLQNERTKRIISGIQKELIKRKKLKIFFMVCILLWSAAGAQWIAERILKDKTELASAFVNSNTVLNESMIELIAFYDASYMTESDKVDLVRYMAEELGIRVDTDAIKILKYEDRESLTYVKTAKQAETTVKCVTLDGEYSKTGKKEHYLLVRIKISEDINEDITVFQKLIQDVFEKLNAKEISNTLQYSGNFIGKLSVDELNVMADQMIKVLGGKTVYENRTLDLYTVYAYSGGITDYISVDGLKINIQVASTYNEAEDRTKIYLATPMISGDW